MTMINGSTIRSYADLVQHGHETMNDGRTMSRRVSLLVATILHDVADAVDEGAAYPQAHDVAYVHPFADRATDDPIYPTAAAYALACVRGMFGLSDYDAADDVDVAPLSSFYDIVG